MSRLESLATFAVVALVAAGAAGPLRGEQPASLPVSGLLAGYLPKGTAPNSLTLLPAPPAPGSAALARDSEAAKAAVALNGSARWDRARLDADLRFPAAANNFACALNAPIDEVSTPKLYILMRRTLTDIGLATYPTKIKYQRARPFTVDGGAICTPEDEAGLRKDGSYPSGHSAIGWGWALILAEIARDRADPILARGRAFGQSRVVCNVHWLSDTEEGRLMASATVATLHDQAEFRSAMAAARAEIAAARAKGLKPAADCAKEAEQLAAG